ncbi:Tubby C-terminal-like domain [Pseudocohnilembus persalinus]|uniref:Tubby C-terminal-like domain n=1 Tax=Pseudocohnilembus persalinus TaxID=266149 RepID=A0A0V0QZR5_PSEPJ|nr:Tubby C-terminal-like domain [Pseudocohnilembus persalinus]|eukprot:KRX07799.1 Tubby C-terminal-like domain [Pseudocohnilembus persalinus]
MKIRIKIKTLNREELTGNKLIIIIQKYKKDTNKEQNNCIRTVNGQAQYEPGQLKGIDNDLPTLTQQNKQFQIQEEKQRSHLRLSDDSDHDLSDKESKKQKDNQQTENLIQNQDQDSNAQIQFSDDSEEEDDSEVITKQMQDLKLEHQNDKEEEDAAQVQVAQEEQKETPELAKKNEDEEEEEEEEDSKNKKIIAKPIDDFDIPDMKEFLTNPLPKGLLLQCTIKRDKSKMSHFYPKYHVYLSKKFQHIMSGKKRSGCKTSNYLISMDKNKIDKKSPGFIGKVRSNFMGTEFHVYDTGLNPKDTKVYEKVRRELACVLYESNILGAKGPRKMKAIVPDIDETTQQPIEWKPLNNNDSMLTKFKANNKNGMQYYFNKPPKWNEHIQAFVLNFNGRVDKASVKNFQLIDEYDEDTILLQFGRVGNDLFNMDLQWPLSPLQAFGICLSSFDYKIACE